MRFVCGFLSLRGCFWNWKIYSQGWNKNSKKYWQLTLKNIIIKINLRLKFRWEADRIDWWERCSQTFKIKKMFSYHRLYQFSYKRIFENFWKAVYEGLVVTSDKMGAGTDAGVTIWLTDIDVSVLIHLLAKARCAA